MKATIGLLLLLVFLCAGSLTGCANVDKTPRATARQATTFNIADFGAKADGKTVSTKAIQRAIDACAAAGGGTVLVPAGRFVTGSLFLKSNVTFDVSGGATLLGSEDLSDYPLIGGRWEGQSVKHHASLINGLDLEHIAVVGHGTIDGRGKVWWELHLQKQLRHARPRLIGLYQCRNVKMKDLRLLNSPSWTVHPVYCEDVVIDGVSVISPADSPNTDGINPDSCRNVRIANCLVDCGDDCITVKSGKDEDGRRVGKPCENIVVTNCVMLRGRGGVVIGSEMSGGVSNVLVSNCVFDGTLRGLRIKTQRGRGGVVQDVQANNIVMRNVQTAFSLDMFYSTTPPEPVSERTPAFRNFQFSNILVRGAQEAGQIKGLSEMPMSEVRFSDMSIEAKRGFFVTDVRGLEMDDVRMSVAEGPLVKAQNAEGLRFDGLRNLNAPKDAPVLALENVRGAMLDGCSAAPGTGTFLRVSGAGSGEVRLMPSNELSKAAKAVVLEKGAPEGALVR